MITIDVRLQINAPKEKVWNVISKIDDDPLYWKGIDSIRKILKERNVITREITLINGAKCFQKIILFQGEGIHIRWTHGPFVGLKDILLTGTGNVTILEIQISYKISGVVRLVSKSFLDELQFETEQAVQLIKQEVEKRSTNILQEIKIMG